jgi:hypothetical protein
MAKAAVLMATAATFSQETAELLPEFGERLQRAPRRHDSQEEAIRYRNERRYRKLTAALKRGETISYEARVFLMSYGPVVAEEAVADG